MNGKMNEVLERIENRGGQLTLDSGLLAIKLPANWDGDPQHDEDLAELVDYIGPVRARLESPIISARAKELAGEKILFADGDDAVLQGTLEDASGQVMTVLVNNPEFRRPMSLSARPENVLIVLAVSASDARAKSKLLRQRQRLSGSEQLELLGQAESLGIRVALDCGLLTAKVTGNWGWGLQPKRDDLLDKIAKQNGEIRQLLEARAIAARAKELAGQKVLIADTDYEPVILLEGVIEDGGSIHRIAVSVIDPTSGRRERRQVKAQNLMVLFLSATAGVSR